MNENLKVLHVVPTLKKDGAEVQLSEVFKNFNNVQVEIFTFDMHEHKESIIENIKEIVLHHKKSFFSIFFLNKLIKDNQYHLIHTHLPKSDLIIGILKYFNKNLIHVVSVHAQYGTRVGENKFKYFFSNILWKRILNRSNGVIAISNKVNRWLIEDLAIKSEKIKTIHYVIEIKNRDKKNYKNNSIGMAARMLSWKGWDKVIETAYYLKELGVNFTLKLAGSDDEGYLETIKKLIQDYDLVENVEIYDHFGNIEEFFEEIDLFLFLSSSEGFGLVVLEAIENNVPVICSDISPLNEFVLDVSGTLVDREKTEEIANRIANITKNPTNFVEINKKQRKNISLNFSIKSSAEKIEKFYINAINV